MTCTTSSFLAFLALVVLISCNPEPKGSFTEWYEREFAATPGNNEGGIHHLEIKSEPMSIDRIYRSMQGPFKQKKISIDEPDEKLVWITGYFSKIMNAETSEAVSDGFMCHNNLNISDVQDYPWKVRTGGSKKRLFTLAEGQMSLRFPEGFAIPVPANHPLDFVSQVLNHNLRDPGLRVYHSVDLNYLKQSELKVRPKPLYQQAIFVTKRTSGPAGHYDEPLRSTGRPAGPGTASGDSTMAGGCLVHYSDSEGKYNPFEDHMGRTFTGHWELPAGREVLHTNVTHMLDLPFNTTVHYIGVHLHPFGESLDLRDLTTGSLLFSAHAEQADNGVGLKRIGHYSGADGIMLYKDHQYELISTYNCTDSGAGHTAMAVMYLYFRDME